VTLHARRPLLAFAALPALLFFACGDDAGESETPSPTITTAASPANETPSPSETATPGEATPTPESTQSNQGANDIVTGPAYFLYVVREGDTAESIAAYFDGVRGAEGRITGAQLISLNAVDPAELEPGDEFAIPLLLSPAAAMMPQNTISEAVTGIPLLTPSQELREGTLDRLALYRVEIATAESGGAGYITEYRLADRSVFKSGAPDPEAFYADDGFIVAGGSLTEDFAAPDGWVTETFEREGAQFVVAVNEQAMGIAAGDLIPLLQ
jgi:hypothetical protein